MGDSNKIPKQRDSKDVKRPGRKGLGVSLHPVSFEDAVEALLETPPPPKDEDKGEKEDKK